VVEIWGMASIGRGSNKITMIVRVTGGARHKLVRKGTNGPCLAEAWSMFNEGPAMNGRWAKTGLVVSDPAVVVMVRTLEAEA